MARERANQAVVTKLTMEGSVDDERSSIRALRQSLNNHPRQPLLWSELARQFVLVGELGRAREAMDCAVALGRGNAYITRSAARFLVHIDHARDGSLDFDGDGLVRRVVYDR